MILSRATALRASSVNTFARSARTLRSRASQQCLRLSQQTGRREYSSAKDTVKKASSDIPWLVSGIAVTIGGTYAALQPRDPVEHHDDHGEGHGDEHEEKEESTEEEPAEESSKDEEKPEEGGEEKASSDGAEKEEAPKEEDTESQEDGEKKDTEESEGKPKSSDSAEVSNKGMTKNASNTAKHEETGTGKKLRLDSTAGQNVGEGVSSGDGDAMSNKQRGISNTDTRHSTDLSKNPEKSQKGEGTVETAKIKGTVDPSRPQV